MTGFFSCDGLQPKSAAARCCSRKALPRRACSHSAARGLKSASRSVAPALFNEHIEPIGCPTRPRNQDRAAIEI